MKPLVSILIPAYNAETWISETLNSAIAQTWPNKEIIVVDDSSKDQTLAVARKFESDQVKVFTHPNSGAAATRNKAFSLCKGDYIQYLDADDLINPNKISSQMEALGSAPDRRVLLSGSWGQFLYRYNRTNFAPSSLWADLAPAEWLTRKMGQNLYMQTASWLSSRELVEAAGPWDTRLLGDDDGEFFCRVLLASHGVKFVPDAKVFYRAAGASSLSYIGNSDKKREAQMISMKLHISYLRSLDDSPRARAACVQYLQNWLVYFWPDRMDIVADAQQMAKALGGELKQPYLSWKYSWIEKLFGWPLAHRAQVLLPRLKWSVIRKWDQTMFRLENRSFADDFGR
jgi:glycosyltransferase involved in cell wall biosynthesis